MNLRRAFKILNGNTLLAILISLLLSLFLISDNSAQQRSSDYDLAILPATLNYVDQYYVDETKIDLNKMTIKGLNKLESLVNEILVHFPDPKSSSDFTVQVNKEVKSYRNVKTDSWSSINEVMQDVFSFVIPNLKSTRIKPVEIEYAVMDTMLKTLDKHSGIITPEVYNEFRIETEGHFGGLGIVIGIRDGQLTVISPLEGTPAYKAGIKSNDKIVQIESESTINMSLMEAVNRLRGKKGTKAKIYIMRDSFNEIKEYLITRDTIKIESVEDLSLDGEILYIKIRDFHKNTIKSLKETIRNNRNDINGIILDLRGNPGGLLEQAQQVANLFLSYGTIVTTKANNYQRSYYAKSYRSEFNGKVVVLVDSGSASASEIVAGALKNNQRAIIIGEKTFGKGSVQQIFDLKGGAALKLTIADYLTPGDISIQNVGITPDIEVVPVIITEKDIIYNDIKENEQTETVPVHKIKYLYKMPIQEQDEQIHDEALAENEKKEKINKDFAVQLAKNIIESVNVLDREEVLKKGKRVITDFISKEEKHIELKWKELGIDWSSGNGFSSDPDLQFQLHPSKPKLIAGEKTATAVTATNNGTNPIYRLRAITASDNPVLNGKEVIFGKLLPGRSKSLDINFDVPEWVNTRNDEVKIKFFHSDNEYIKESNFDISTIAKGKPLFAYNFEVVDDGRYGSTGNANGELDEGEQISLVFNIKNTGTSKSPKTIVTIKNLSGEALYLQKGRFELAELKPGESQIASFLFRVNNKNNINLEISITDDASRQIITTNRVDLVRSNNTEKFVRSEGWVTIEKRTPIMGGNDTLPLIAYAESGSVFDLLGYKGEHAKIRLPTLERAGWVLKENIKIDKEQKKEKDSHDFKEVFFYSQPSIDIASTSLVTNKKEISIRGSVTDNNKIESISIFKGDDKIKLLTPNKNSQVFSFNSSLEDGINVFSIVAKDTSGLFSKETVTIRKSTSPVTLND